MLIPKDDECFSDCDNISCEIFIPKATNQNTFALSFDVQDMNCKVKIYIDECLQETDTYETGDVVGIVCEELYCEVDVWRKYFFPTFNKEQYQWYHPESYSDDIKAMAEVLEYARKRAMEIINI